MANRNGKVPGTYVSQGELNELGKLLTTMREYLVSHEARLELIEGWINEYMEMHAPQIDESLQVETDGVEETSSEEAFENEGGLVEPANDPEEG